MDALANPNLTRPVLRWHGGKWRLAPWIISHFPPHRIYVEPYGGAASVLLRKGRCFAEVYNDLDAAVVGLFRVLRDPGQSQELVRAITLTPFSRIEFDDAFEQCGDPIEDARRLIIRSFMGFGSNAHALATRVSRRSCFRTAGVRFYSTGFRDDSKKSGTTPALDWMHYPPALEAIAERFRGVVIEQRDALAVMRKHDTPATLHYVDPPYVPATRSISRADGRHRIYRHEVTDEGHAELLAFLPTLKGTIVLSGYPSRMYDDALRGWRRVEKKAYADGARERTEVLWIKGA